MGKARRCEDTQGAQFSRLVQIQLAFYPCDPFSTNNCNMTGNGVEKNVFLC